MAALWEERQGHRVFLRDNTKLFDTWRCHGGLVQRAACRGPAPRTRGSACRESGYPDANEVLDSNARAQLCKHSFSSNQTTMRAWRGGPRVI